MDKTEQGLSCGSGETPDETAAGHLRSASVRVERNGVALVATIDRPSARNALSRDTLREVIQAVQGASRDDSTRALILAASGSVFASGGDLREFAGFAASSDGVEQVLEMGRSLSELERCEVPVIASVQGHAFGGGCELVLAADLVVMEQQATLSFRQAAMGLSTAWGGATRLLERVGSTQSARLLMVGEPVSATEALELGIACELTPQGGALARALAVAQAIARYPRAAIAGIKRSLRLVREARRGTCMDREQQVFAELWNGPDHQAALDAFLNRKSI